MKLNKIENKMKFVISLIVFILISCGDNCESLNNSFTSYDNAIEFVRATNFKIEDKLNTESTWIDSIEFYSCDEITGYLIINTKTGKTYIHKNVPKQLWNEFKETNSFGRFYNQNIKGRYYLGIN